MESKEIFDNFIKTTTVTIKGKIKQLWRDSGSAMWIKRHCIYRLLKDKDYAENIYSKLLKCLFLLHMACYKDPDTRTVCLNDSVNTFTDSKYLVRKSQNYPVFQQLTSSITMELKQHDQMNPPFCLVLYRIYSLSPATLWNVLAYIRMNCFQCLLIRQSRTLLSAFHVMLYLT